MSEAWEDFFNHTAAPADHADESARLHSWVARHAQRGRKMALVTSGGTTVPLERNTVRFLDNFSLGTRGAVSCEQFLRQGYAVVFLHRDSSVLPFVRHLRPQVLLDALAGVQGLVRLADSDGGAVAADCGATEAGGDTSDRPKKSEETAAQTDELQREGETRLEGSAEANLKLVLDKTTSLQLGPVVQQYRTVVLDDLLFSLPFSSLASYLWWLRTAATALQLYAARQPALLYLAAAVADFYIPHEDLSEHKLQSSSGPLSVELQVVPKMLAPLVAEWGPSLYVVSFKLETDVTKLLDKAQTALQRYRHHLVVGNLLQTRRTEVTLVQPASANDPYAANIDTMLIKLTDEHKAAGQEIEALIVEEVCSRHKDFLKKIALT